MIPDLSPWRSWPLLAAGVSILAIDVAILVAEGDQPIAAGLLLGVGAVMTGAGIANVIRHPVGAAGGEESDRGTDCANRD